MLKERLPRAGPALLGLLVVLAAGTVTAGHESGHMDAEFQPKAGNEWWVETDVTADEPLASVDARADGGDWVALEKKDWGSWAKSFHVPHGSIVEFRATSTDGDAVVSDGYVWPSAEPAGDSGGEMTASFDPVPGNEWWVEVNVRASEPLAGVSARDDGGAWIALDKQDWGSWAKSFHVESGSVIEFRATSTDGDTVVSQGYLWPSAEPAGGGGGDGEMTASFDPVPGNEWWVEVYVDANEPLSGVWARDDGGAWVALEKKSWGAWAESFHVEDGSVVEFRATSTDGDTVVSGGYVWPGAEPVDGEEPPDTVDAAFGPKAGNEWWVETLVVAEDPVTRVEARADGGAWHDLSLRDWGAWAGSFHAPDGSVVQFRATTGAGTDTSHGFTWPDATVVGSDGSWPEEGSYLRSETRSSSPGPVTSQGHSTAVWHDGQWWVHSHREGEDPGGSFEDESFCTGSHIPGGPTDVAVGDRVDVQVGTCHEGYYDVYVRERTTYDTHRDGDPVTLEAWSGDRTDPCLCLRWEAEWDVETGLLLHTERAGRSSHVTDLVDTDAPVG